MAELFVATAPGEHGFQKKVVIKRLLPHLVEDDTYNAMFIDEAKLTARLVHPKIAQTFELGKVGEALFIAMEFIDGIDVLALLREFATRRRRIAPALAAWIAAEVLDALDYAHNLADEDGRTLGIVHRDISPSNVLLSMRGDVKLVDFGIARAIDPDRAHKSKSGTLKGKYGYMSPEQVTEQRVDSRSDLFSVGVVLAELLTGRRLFAAANELDVLLMVRDAKLTRLDKYGADLDPNLQSIVRTALKKPVDERWQNAAAFREALSEWLFENRKRMTPKNVADVVHDLRDAVTDRRAKQLDGDTAIIEHNDRPVASLPTRVPTGDGVPALAIDAGDSMPMISMSYEPAEEQVPARPVTASDLAASAAVVADSKRTGPRAVIPVRAQSESDLTRARAGSEPRVRPPSMDTPQRPGFSSNDDLTAPPAPRGTPQIASIPPAPQSPPVVKRPPTPTPAAGTGVRTPTPAIGVRSLTPPSTPVRPTPMPPTPMPSSQVPAASPARSRVTPGAGVFPVPASKAEPHRHAEPSEGIVEVPIADTISAAIENITMPGDDSGPAMIHAPAEPGAPELPHIRTRTEDSGIRAFDALTEMPRARSSRSPRSPPSSPTSGRRSRPGSPTSPSRPTTRASSRRRRRCACCSG